MTFVSRSLLRRRLSLLAALALAASSTGCMLVNLSALGSRELTEVTVQTDDGWGVRDKILLLDISGTIGSNAGTLLGGGDGCTPDYVKAALNKAEKDRAIRGVVLRIDSPGGTVSASDLIAREVEQFARKTRLPVYTQVLDLCCSGGYYIAAATKKIYAQPAAITGSIGVIAVLPKYKQLADKLGVETVVIKSGALKDIGSGMRDMTPEERQVFEAMIAAFYDQFLARVAQGRPHLTLDRITALADGRIYTAPQAKANGLIDELGYLDDTLDALKRDAGLRRARVVSYVYGDSADANVYSPAGVRARAALDIHAALPAPLTQPRAGFLYLWAPGR